VKKRPPRQTDKTLSDCAREMSPAQFEEHLEETQLQLGQGQIGLDLLWHIEAADIRKVLLCEQHPLREAVVNLGVARFDEELDRDHKRAGANYLAYVMSRARDDWPLCRAILERVGNRILTRDEHSELQRYLAFRKRPRRSKNYDPKILTLSNARADRDQVVITFMKWLVDVHCMKEGPAAACLAAVMDHIGVKRLGDQNIRRMYAASKREEG
jgi:hypothetical protein